MKILIVNSGSSSIKFQLFEMPQEKLVMKCKAEKTGSGGVDFQMNTTSGKVFKSLRTFSFANVFNTLAEEMVRCEPACIRSVDEVDIIGHRLIHGAEKTSGCEIITGELLAYMRSNISLAPLHYPANLEGIKTISELMPGKLQAGVFDTAFHAGLPPKAYLYGISADWCYRHRIRRYGFHGTSHRYASITACKLAGRDVEDSRVVSCHLGNGASMAAIRNGQSVDTSMGLTPVEGLLMGSRCGDIDAGILIHLMDTHGFSSAELQQLINKEGGLLGLSGVSADYREVEEAARKGHSKACTALDVYHYRVKKYIGAYAAALEGLDVLVFTGGIGENSSRARKEICGGLQFLGVEIDTEKNENQGATDAVISLENAKVAVAVVAANEELEIARQVAALVTSGKHPGR